MTKTPVETSMSTPDSRDTQNTSDPQTTGEDRQQRAGDPDSAGDATRTDPAPQPIDESGKTKDDPSRAPESGTP